MARGIQRRVICRDDRDRGDFRRRLTTLAQAGAVTLSAWALLPNHVHLLVRTGQRPLAGRRRSLLTGYAVVFNRRHRRHGYLFQNRYKSILCQEEPYLLELVRYLHLNPLRAGVVPDVQALDRYPWTGHSAVLGRVRRPWQAVGKVLGHFGRGPAARRQYRAFVAAGVPHGRRPELQGGGLRRSAGGWEAAASSRASSARSPGLSRRVALDGVLTRVAGVWNLTPAELTGGSRRRAVVAARYAASYLGVRELGLPATRVARALGVSPQAVLRGAERGGAILVAQGVMPADLLGGE